MRTRYANMKDLNYLIKHDNHIKKQTIRKKIKLKEYILYELEKKIIGFMRFGFIWSAIPYIEIIKVDEEFRKRGFAKEMVNFLEKIAKKNKQKFILSSSTGNEKEPQNWHKKIGFKEIGKLKQINYPSKVPEVFFIKKIK